MFLGIIPQCSGIFRDVLELEDGFRFTVVWYSMVNSIYGKEMKVKLFTVYGKSLRLFFHNVYYYFYDFSFEAK